MPVFEIDQPDHYAQYILTNPREIAFHLRALVSHRSMAALYFENNLDSVLTTPLAVDDANGQILLDPPNQQSQLEKLLAQHYVTLSSDVERVKVQCKLKLLKVKSTRNGTVIAAPLPDRLLRLQRREFFRIETPRMNPLRCKLTKQHGEDNIEEFDYVLHDISGGGLCLIGDGKDADKFSRGEVFNDCRLEIPGEYPLAVNLKICLVMKREILNGDFQLRLGCEFHNLSGARQSAIERYITRLERERSARESGLS